MGTQTVATEAPKETAEQRKAREAAVQAAIAAAIEKGDIKVLETVRDAEGKVTDRVSVVIREKNLERHYTKLAAVNREGALALTGGDDAKVWSLFTEAHDLKVRAKIRQQMLAEVEEPEKNYLAAAKALAKLPMYKNRADLKGLDSDAVIEVIAAELQASEETEEGTETEAPATDTPAEEAAQ